MNNKCPLLKHKGQNSWKTTVHKFSHIAANGRTPQRAHAKWDKSKLGSQDLNLCPGPATYYVGTQPQVEVLPDLWTSSFAKLEYFCLGRLETECLRARVLYVIK